MLPGSGCSSTAHALSRHAHCSWKPSPEVTRVLLGCQCHTPAGTWDLSGSAGETRSMETKHRSGHASLHRPGVTWEKGTASCTQSSPFQRCIVQRGLHNSSQERASCCSARSWCCVDKCSLPSWAHQNAGTQLRCCCLPENIPGEGPFLILFLAQNTLPSRQRPSCGAQHKIQHSALQAGRCAQR